MPRSRSIRQPYVIFCTASSKKEAGRIAQLLIYKRLAACVSIVPGIHSVFRWAGKVDRAREWLLVIKTTKNRLTSLRRAVARSHSYEVPELIGWPVSWGSQPYLDWLRQSTAD